MEETIYHLGQWRGYTTYCCNFCPFDTMKEAEAIAHYEDRHKPRALNPQPLGIAIADKAGREVWSGEPPTLAPTEDLAPEPPRRRKKTEV